MRHNSSTFQINVSAINLIEGVYTYSLVVDGKVTDTKKMVKVR